MALGEKFTSVQFSRSVVSDSLRSRGLPGFPALTNSRGLLKLMSIELVMPSNHFILCYPLLLLPSISPSIKIFSQSALSIRWPKCLSFSFSISPSNEYSGLISFRIDWFHLLVVQGTLQSLLQHNSKASVLQCSAFFTVQLLHLCMTIGKTTALTTWIFVGKEMSWHFSTVLVFHSFPAKKCS